MRWFTPKEREAYWHRVTLERAGTELIRAADRPRRRTAKPKPKPKPNPAPNPAPNWPRKYTLSDLATLRKLGRVP